MGLKKMECPSCGGIIKYNNKRKAYVCEYCSTLYKDENENNDKSSVENKIETFYTKTLDEHKRVFSSAVDEHKRVFSSAVKRAKIMAILIVVSTILFMGFIILRVFSAF